MKIKLPSFFSKENDITKSLLKVQPVNRSTLYNVLCALFPNIWLILFFLCPLIIIFKISISTEVYTIPPFKELFSIIDKYSVNVYLSIKNYMELIADSYYSTAFINSILLASISTVLCLIFGFFIAHALISIKSGARTILLLLISLSFWTSFLLRIYAWINLLSFHGIVNSLLLKFHIIDNPIRFIGNYGTVCLGMVFCYLPFMIFPIYSILEKMDVSCLEAAADLGSRPTQTFWRITFPLSMPGIYSGCILVFSTSIGEFVIPELLGGPDTLTLGRVLWIEFFNNLNWPAASAVAIVVMFIIILPGFIFQKRIALSGGIEGVQTT
ncbi:MAG: ABC transporter permease subunit [Holosporales bacterium]|nr:ABC transporter permease subunit [Holosporales bacterium]